MDWACWTCEAITYKSHLLHKWMGVRARPEGSKTELWDPLCTGCFPSATISFQIQNDALTDKPIVGMLDYDGLCLYVLKSYCSIEVFCNSAQVWALLVLLLRSGRNNQDIWCTMAQTVYSWQEDKKCVLPFRWSVGQWVFPWKCWKSVAVLSRDCWFPSNILPFLGGDRSCVHNP